MINIKSERKKVKYDKLSQQPKILCYLNLQVHVSIIGLHSTQELVIVSDVY